jgi:hypothetical protein
MNHSTFDKNELAQKLTAVTIELVADSTVNYASYQNNVP